MNKLWLTYVVKHVVKIREYGFFKNSDTSKQKNTELYTSNGWITQYLNFIPIKLLIQK